MLCSAQSIIILISFLVAEKGAIAIQRPVLSNSTNTSSNLSELSGPDYNTVVSQNYHAWVCTVAGCHSQFYQPPSFPSNL